MSTRSDSNEHELFAAWLDGEIDFSDPELAPLVQSDPDLPARWRALRDEAAALDAVAAGEYAELSERMGARGGFAGAVASARRQPSASPRSAWRLAAPLAAAVVVGLVGWAAWAFGPWGDPQEVILDPGVIMEPKTEYSASGQTFVWDYGRAPGETSEIVFKDEDGVVLWKRTDLPESRCTIDATELSTWPEVVEWELSRQRAVTGSLRSVGVRRLRRVP